MRKNMLVFLAALFLLSACTTSQITPTPTPDYLAPRPTPTLAYQVIGETRYTSMVLVDPKSNTDREGLQRIGDYLCTEFEKCKIWFWDDINTADTSYPVDADKEQFVIAYYSFNWQEWKSTLKVYTLGDPR